ncbi:hypothetical protein DENSPDRAFT_305406 [Dentipellis sp. KUC8613]|nr:hypothetical protein DENSPDRAFT_305406 [Dentipellis sp. KUC8613]
MKTTQRTRNSLRAHIPGLALKLERNLLPRTARPAKAVQKPPSSKFSSSELVSPSHLSFPKPLPFDPTLNPYFTMKPTTFFTTVLAVSLSLLSAIAAPLPSDQALNATAGSIYDLQLQERAGPAPLPNLLGSSRLLYRAVTNDEMALLQTRYPLHGSPTGHKGEAGDFSSTGAIYAFFDKTQAQRWGQSFTTPRFKNYFLVTFTYTPSTSLHQQAFATGTRDWVRFVTNNYAGIPQPGFDIVEGPISVKAAGSFTPSIDQASGQMLWQSAFVTPAALHTLTISNIENVAVTPAGQKTRFCPGCTIS